MTGRGQKGDFLTCAVRKQASLLTLIVTFFLPAPFSHADPLPPAQAEELKEQVSQVSSYVRKEALQGMSILPNDIRSMTSWLSGSWHTVDMQSSAGDEAAPVTESLPPSPIDETGTGLGTNFHHKGFLPTHDAMLMGVNLKQNILPGKLGITGRPFYGQNWHAVQGYWGSEASLDIARHEDGLPWGRLAVGYVGGNEQLTDHGRGMEAHGDVDLTEHWQFTTGLRQNSSDGNSNYMMVKWKLDFK